MQVSTALKSTLAIFLMVFSSSLLPHANAQTQLLKDLDNSLNFTRDSDPQPLVPLNGSVYFRAYSENTGVELYKSDGTESGTVLVKDISPGLSNSVPNYLTVSNGHIFFYASDVTSGAELWKSDGTGSGTVLVKDIVPGRPGSTPSDLINIGGTIYFTAFTSEHGRELWKSDGTEEGTVMVKDIRNGPSDGMSISSTNLTPVNGVLFFTAFDGINGRELWKSDGTEAGTVMVSDLNPGSLSTSFYNLTSINNTLYFTSDGGGFGQELWKSDGTEGGTVLVKDIAGGNSGPGKVFLFKGEIYFSAYDANGYEIWKTDGTDAGTILIKDINPGPGSSLDSTPGSERFVIMGDYFYFAADDGINYQQLWRSDGTAYGTTMVKKIHPSNHSSPYNITVVNNTLFFRAAGDGSSTDFNSELWKSDGTEAGTVLVKDIRPEVGSSPLYMAASNGMLFFTADDGISGMELWRSDGTEVGTFLVKDINRDFSSCPRALAVSEDDLFFVNIPGGKKYEIWKSDGTTEGTALVKDINPAAVSFTGINATNVEGKLFFTIDDGTHGYELWVSDGTDLGTKLVKDIFPGPASSYAGLNISSFRYIGGVVFFMADDGINGTELWKSDGTEAGTVKVKNLDLSHYTTGELSLVIENTFYFFDDFRLFKSDGTEGGTSLVKDINPLKNGFGPSGFVNNNGALYFSVDDGIHGFELWKSDGTETGTLMVKDIFPDNGFHQVVAYGALNGIVYMVAGDAVHGFELWKSDGTEAGTAMVKDIYAGPSSSFGPVGFCAVGNTFYFYTQDEEHGWELWKSDGTSQGTMLVKDIYPGPMSSMSGPDYLKAFKGILYFYAEDGVHGTELWRSDGTSQGTYMVEDINTSPIGSAPRSIVAGDDLLYFTANDGTHGREVWKFNPSYIKFDAIPDKVATDEPFAINAFAYSGLPVSFNIVTGPATVTGTTVTLTGSGTVAIRASQPGNEVYNPAEYVERTFNVTRAQQLIIFEPLEEKNSDDEPFELTASASSGLPVTFSIASGPATLSNNIVSLAGGGTITVKASQAGNAKFARATDVEQSFEVNLILSTEHDSNFPIKISPNPSKDIINVELIQTDVFVFLMNSVGQKVFLESRVSENKFSINVSDLPKGLYLLHIGDKEKDYTRKIIVE